MASRIPLGLVRAAAALAGIVALVGRFVYGQGFRSFVSVDFFGYLTVQSNLAAVAMHAIAAYAVLRGRPEPSWLSAGRAAITTFVIVAGIVFAIFVAQAPAQGYRIDVPWSDRMLHFFLPAYALADYLIAPGRRQVRWRVLAVVVGYPVVWGVVTIVRGGIVGWYPYFFLDPAQSGYPGILVLYSSLALGLFAAVASCLIGASRSAPLGEWRKPPSAEPSDAVVRQRRPRGTGRATRGPL